MVSVSGGPDSTALLHLLWAFSKEGKRFPIAICHVDYGLRGEESRGDRRFVEALGQKLGVPVRVQEAGPRPAGNLQAWARGIRQDLYREFAEEGWLTALGHHRDDMAESALMRLCSGSLPSGLLAMKRWQAPIWRPLLDEPKEALEGWCHRHNVPYRRDSSNASIEFKRNGVRHKVLKDLKVLYPRAAEKIVACVASIDDLAGSSAQRPAVRREWLRSTLGRPPKRSGLLREWHQQGERSSPGRPSPREQHARSCQGGDLWSQLPAGGELRCFDPQHDWRLTASAEGATLRLQRPVLRAPLAGGRAIKETLARSGVPIHERHLWWRLTVGGEPPALTRGGPVLRPDGRGQLREVSARVSCCRHAAVL